MQVHLARCTARASPTRVQPHCAAGCDAQVDHARSNGAAGGGPAVQSLEYRLAQAGPGRCLRATPTQHSPNSMLLP